MLQEHEDELEYAVSRASDLSEDEMRGLKTRITTLEQQIQEEEARHNEEKKDLDSETAKLKDRIALVTKSSEEQQEMTVATVIEETETKLLQSFEDQKQQLHTEYQAKQAEMKAIMQEKQKEL